MQQKTVVVVTGFAVALLGAAFAFLTWDQADRLAGVLSALLAVAGLGASVAALVAAPGPAPRTVEVSGTGDAVARNGGSANTGYRSDSSSPGDGTVRVADTGDARADGGEANTGYRQG